MFLVTVSTCFDDIPLRVFHNDMAAVVFAKEQDGTIPESTLESLSIDQPEAIGIAVWEFDGETGNLVSRTIVQWFDEEVDAFAKAKGK